MDLPVFVDVSSIVSGYSLQTGVNVGGSLSSAGAAQGDFLSAGAAAVYTDRPTITYTPMTGEKFLRSLLSPIEPKNIFFLLQSGYPADFVLGLTVESLNGVRNRSVEGGVIHEADDGFVRAITLMREVQMAGAVGMRVEENSSKRETAVLFFRRDSLSPEIAEKSMEIRRLLGLSPDQQRFVLTYSPARGSAEELAVNSRSMLQIMKAFSSYLDVPEEHLRDHRAMPAFEHVSPEARKDVVRINSGKERPAAPFAAVHYRDYWYWVDDGDWPSKRALTAIMFFFTLVESGGGENLPVVTIPAQ